MDDALEFLAKTCRGKLEPGAEVSTAGIGSEIHKDKINKALDIK